MITTHRHFLCCTVVVPGPNGDLATGGFSMMMMMMIGWLVIATALFLLRPASLRRESNEKPSGMVGVGDVLHHTCSQYYWKAHVVTALCAVFFRQRRR